MDIEDGFLMEFVGDKASPLNTSEGTLQSAMVYLKYLCWDRDFSSSITNSCTVHVYEYHEILWIQAITNLWLTFIWSL